MNSLTNLALMLCLTVTAATAQTDTLQVIPPLQVPFLKISGYIETYYSYDFNTPENNTRPSFMYSHNRHNEVALNLGLIKATYNNDKVRASLALMAGTYTNANLAAEESTLKNI